MIPKHNETSTSDVIEISDDDTLDAPYIGGSQHFDVYDDMWTRQEAPKTTDPEKPKPRVNQFNGIILKSATKPKQIDFTNILELD
jgi:hypothetical protein